MRLDLQLQFGLVHLHRHNGGVAVRDHHRKADLRGQHFVELRRHHELHVVIGLSLQQVLSDVFERVLQRVDQRVDVVFVQRVVRGAVEELEEDGGLRLVV